MLEVMFLVLVMTTMCLVPLAFFGVKYLYDQYKIRKFAKEGYVKVEIIKKNGGVVEYIVKPEGNIVKLEKKAYLLTNSAGFRDEGTVAQDGGVIQLDVPLEKSKMLVEPTGMKKWIVFEDDAIPIGTDNKEPLLNPRFLYEVIMQEAQAHSIVFDKYFKLILLALAGLAGLIIMVAGGGSYAG